MASIVLMRNPSSMSNVIHAVGMVPRSHSSRQARSPKKMKPSLPSSIITKAFPSAKVARACSGLAQLWREIQGFNNWDNLVNPLHPLLRQEIIRYGEFVIACYEAFDLNPSSNRYLTCKYGKRHMFQEVGLQNSGYEVTKYIYATPSININIPIQNGVPNCGRWIGYVAVSSEKDTVSRLGRRDVLVTFRGTATSLEWIANFMSSLTPARLDPHNPRPDVKVQSGFLSLYTSDESDRTKFGLRSCREQLLSEISRLLNKYKDEQVSISLAGHSLGGALALLLAYDIAELGLHRMNQNWDVPITVFSFGGPRVGNAGFKERCEELGVKALRIVNVNDPITKLPGVFLNENYRDLGERWSRLCYAHVGVELVLDFFNMQDPSCVHDLETYISLLKCPIQKQDVESVSRAKDLIFFEQNFSLTLSNAARKMISLLQSQGIEYLTGENIPGLMINLALYIFL